MHGVGLTLARPLVGQQLVALPAAALEAAHGVAAEVVTAPVVGQALVDVCGAPSGQGEASGLGCQVAGPLPPRLPAPPGAPASSGPRIPIGVAQGPGLQQRGAGREAELRCPPQFCEPGRHWRPREEEVTAVCGTRRQGWDRDDTRGGGAAWSGPAASPWLCPGVSYWAPEPWLPHPGRTPGGADELVVLGCLC